jgi:glycosyltransferase involved in cell wall biosynthesis
VAIHQAQQAVLNKDHRGITISFIGVTDDQIGVELARLADQLLNPGSFTILPRMKHSDVLSEIGKCNVVVSLAENESFGIYIAEAMSSGAIVIRTRISGYEETVKESLNGYGIEPKISQLAEKLIQLSNISEFPHQKFLQMMEKSKEIIQPFLESKYSNVTEFFADGRRG